MDNACCAHLRVSWRTESVGGGLTRGWWECDFDCGMRFGPDAAVPKEAGRRKSGEESLAATQEHAPGSPSSPPSDAARVALWERALDLIEWANDLRVGSRPDVGQWSKSLNVFHDAILAYVEDDASPPTDAAQLAAVRLLALKENWDTYGAPIISKIAVDAALQLRNVLAAVPSFVPMSNGGVQIEWHSQGFDVELEIQPNGRLAHPEEGT